MLVKLHSDIKELARQMNYVATVVQSLQPAIDDTDLQLPHGVSIPMNSVDDMEAMEAALDDMQFRKRLVGNCIQLWLARFIAGLLGIAYEILSSYFSVLKKCYSK